jgi:hypothetical protein
MSADDSKMFAPAAPPLQVVMAKDDDAATWARFVQDANDGTLHHDLSFLAYHPRERFNFANIIVRRGQEVVAVVPGGLVEKEGGPVFASPLGASVGGPLILRPLLAETTSVIEALQIHAKSQGWTGIEFVLGPKAYQRRPADTTSFALFVRGFRLIDRDLSFIVPIEPGARDLYATLFRKKQAWGVRSAGRRGVTVSHGGRELLAPFLEAFRDTYERHGTAATHTETEITDLLERLPGRIEITVAFLDGAPIASILVFRLNDRAAQTFYICTARSHARENGTVAALSALIDRLAAAGVRALDLGPSASSKRVNEGVVFFKEGLGAAGQTRDRWSWAASATEIT